MMPMLLTAADRQMLIRRVVARLEREHPDDSCTGADFRLAVNHEAAALIAEGDFISRDGTLIRRPAGDHDCVAGWVAVEDPILGGLIDTRCPECSP